MSFWKQIVEDILGKPQKDAAAPRRRPAKTKQGLGSDAADTIRDLRSPLADSDLTPDPAAGTLEDPAAADHAVAAGESRAEAAWAPTAQVPEGTHSAKPALVVGASVFGVALALSLAGTLSAVVSAKQRLQQPNGARQGIAVAQEAELGYCTADFKQVLERVLHSCGLADQSERRGCKPSDIKTFAAISDPDFNALFQPLQQRGGVLMFDDGSDVLDDAGKALLEKRWYERKGARYFFVVARASKTGNPEKNRALSHRRANSVLFYLKEVSGETEAELSRKVGLLWLGNEYAQLPTEYCGWPRSRETSRCDEEAVNRSAFVSWVDCRL